jgi:hypothetical protein
MMKVTEEQRRARVDRLREQFDVDLDDADGWWVRPVGAASVEQA